MFSFDILRTWPRLGSAKQKTTNYWYFMAGCYFPALGYANLFRQSPPLVFYAHLRHWKIVNETVFFFPRDFKRKLQMLLSSNVHTHTHKHPISFVPFQYATTFAKIIGVNTGRNIKKVEFKSSLYFISFSSICFDSRGRPRTDSFKRRFVSDRYTVFLSLAAANASFFF